jgi:hypothetical protein
MYRDSGILKGGGKVLLPSLLFGVWIACAVMACFLYLIEQSLAVVGVATLCGAVAAALLLISPSLPRVLQPSPGVIGLFVSFIPAFFIPEIFFLGIGLIFMVACAFAGGIFGVVLKLLNKRASRN